MRLSDQNLPSAEAVQLPDYDRTQVAPGIVHLGVGNFHRAHQAVYIDDVLRADPSWGILGVSLRSPATSQALRPQNGLYTVTETSAQGRQTRVIGSLLDVMPYVREPDKTLRCLTSADTKIVSLTITEKAYARDPVTGNLDPSNPDIAADLDSSGTAPRSAIGLLVHSLKHRRAAGVATFTVLPCDNLPSNGAALKRLLTQFAAIHDDALASWIEAEVAVPSTMVDRIVPATTDADRAAIDDAIGVDDAWPVVTEPFRQWVVEDTFPSGRPDLAAAGAELVSDVHAHETMKLRLLNGAHSTLAYLGLLLGHETVAEAMGDPDLRTLIQGMWSEEIAPTLTLGQSTSRDYAAALTTRFDNPTLNHRLAQIAMDGSQKISQRLLGTITDRLHVGHPHRRLILAVAGWLAFLHGRLAQLEASDAPAAVKDPLAATLHRMAAGTSPQQFVEAICAISDILGTPAIDATFRKTLQAMTADLAQGNIRAAIQKANAL
ncbi:MAG: mannitol dehydrogenase family protein [Pseudomonadota bacterium]